MRPMFVVQFIYLRKQRERYPIIHLRERGNKRPRAVVPSD